jgi:hypothetical protein
MGSDGWDEPPLDIQIPDDARELDRDVLAYRRELRAARRRSRLKRLAGPLASNGALMPLLASILAVCLVAGAMLSVATFSPAPGVRNVRTTFTPTATATHTRPVPSTPPRASRTAKPTPSPSGRKATVRPSSSPRASSSATPR